MDWMRTYLLTVENCRKGSLCAASAVPSEAPVLQLLALDLTQQGLDQGVFPTVLLLLLTQHQSSIGQSPAVLPVETFSEYYLSRIRLLLDCNLWQLSSLLDTIFHRFFILWFRLHGRPMSVSEEASQVQFVLL